MSDEDRSQAPSKRRRQLAREQGIVARSSELTTAAALLAGVFLLGAWGDDLVAAMTAASRSPSRFDALTAAPDPAAVAAQLRGAVLAVLVPLGAILGGVALAAIAAHQAQVGGLWLPGRLAPDASRLWSTGNFGQLGQGTIGGAWSIAKAAVVVVVAAAVLRAHAFEFADLARLPTPVLAIAVGSLLRSLLGTLALALVALGAADYWLQHRRIEALLMATPEENREDQKAIEGDPSLRSRRRRLAESRRFDPLEAVTGAKLALVGPGGLALVLGGGPPGRRPILVRAAAKGANGRALLQAAEQAGLPVRESAAIARHLARADRAPLPAALGDELEALWPTTP